MSKKIKVVIIGASGYTGAELVRLLNQHPKVEIVALTANSNANKPISEIYPHLQGYGLPQMVHLDDLDFNTDYSNIDVVFCCLPHATTQRVIKELPKDLVVIDLSADFRLDSLDDYKEWYGKPHEAPELQDDAVYGLSEIYKSEIEKSRLIACPGCYPTSVLLPLIPLAKEGIIDPDSIIIDAKSGVTGAGRSPKQATLYAEVSESVKPYGLNGHRHLAEIEQEVGKASKSKVVASFTPQVVPMSRGMLSSIYVQLNKKQSAKSAIKTLKKYYSDKPFVTILEGDSVPTTRDVSATNHCKIGVYEGRKEGQLVILSVIDNLVKGASGQAVQNMNIKFGLDEAEGLHHMPVFP